VNDVLDAAATAACLPWPALTQELAAVLRDPSVQAPTRMVQALPAGGTLFLMPAFDETLAITKLITYTPGNIGTSRPTIQGDVLVLDGTTGQRVRVLDGPTVTARRTAAVSLLAAQHLVPQLRGPLLIVGAGVQGQSHLEAFAACWDLQEVWICSRSQHSAQRLATLARSLGLTARVVTDANAAMARCPLVVTCTPATEVVLRVPPRDDSFVAAVGAFTPRMQEIGPGPVPALCRTWHCGGGHLRRHARSRRPAAGGAGRRRLSNPGGRGARHGCASPGPGPVQELWMGGLGPGRSALCGPPGQRA
jgi:1-piperideine-2-carboxylate/1-pyrroline-2-carboxylate reductase [NAD(P)H]